MSISSVQELIAALKQRDPEEALVYTYWGEDDYNSYKDQAQAISLIEDALDNCIGHVNDYLESQYQDEEGK
jgi:hypothetical protein